MDLVQSYTPPVAVSGQTTYLYNLSKQLTRITRPDGQMIAFDYDAGGRLHNLTTPRGPTTYLYDAVTGNLATISAPDGGTLNYAYDGFLPLSAVWNGLVQGTVSQTYDNNFRVSSQSVNGGFPINFTYDLDGLVTKAGDLQVTRDVLKGSLKGTSLGGTVTAFTYDTFLDLGGNRDVVDKCFVVFGLKKKYSDGIYYGHLIRKC